MVNSNNLNFFMWFNQWNLGHKRLWIVISAIWFSTIMIPSGIKFMESVDVCKKSNDMIFVYKKIRDYCDYESSYSSIFNRDILEKVSPKFNFIDILWAVIPLIFIPILVYIIAWVRSGYKKNSSN